MIPADILNMPAAEILSRFGQTKPVDDLRLAGEVFEYSEYFVFGKVGSVQVRLMIRNPDSIERYRVKAQGGWIYCAFTRGRFSEIAVMADGVWTASKAAP